MLPYAPLSCRLGYIKFSSHNGFIKLCHVFIFKGSSPGPSLQALPLTNSPIFSYHTSLYLLPNIQDLFFSSLSPNQSTTTTVDHRMTCHILYYIILYSFRNPTVFHHFNIPEQQENIFLNPYMYSLLNDTQFAIP